MGHFRYIWVKKIKGLAFIVHIYFTVSAYHVPPMGLPESVLRVQWELLAWYQCGEELVVWCGPATSVS